MEGTADFKDIRKFKVFSLEIQWSTHGNCTMGSWSIGNNKRLVGSWTYIRSNHA